MQGGGLGRHRHTPWEGGLCLPNIQHPASRPHSPHRDGLRRVVRQLLPTPPPESCACLARSPRGRSAWGEQTAMAATTASAVRPPRPAHPLATETAELFIPCPDSCISCFQRTHVSFHSHEPARDNCRPRLGWRMGFGALGVGPLLSEATSLRSLRETPRLQWKTWARRGRCDRLPAELRCFHRPQRLSRIWPRRSRVQTRVCGRC